MHAFALLMLLGSCLGERGFGYVNDSFGQTFGYSEGEAVFFASVVDKRSVRDHGKGLEAPPSNIAQFEAHYAGSLVGSLKHGYGKLIVGGPSPDRHDVYLGTFYNDVRHGYGICEVFDSTGNIIVYTGQYFNDKQHGSGSIHTSEGHNYDGQFLFGLQWGRLCATVTFFSQYANFRSRPLLQPRVVVFGRVEKWWAAPLLE
jgi:hypothetical protein